MDNCIVKEFFGCTSINHFFKLLPSNSNLNFTCLHLNIRSLIKNYTKLLHVIQSSSSPLDIIILTEVGISENIANLFNIPGYNMHTQLRSNKKGGGIIVYIKKFLKFTPLHHKTITFESIFGIIKFGNRESIVLCAIYRPPSFNKILFVRELGRCLSHFGPKDNLLLMGDINIDLKRASSYRDSYLETLSECGLSCGITDYTRIAEKQNIITRSCIDHILVRLPTLHPHSAAVDLVLADHRAVILACVSDASRVHIQGVTKNVIEYETYLKELNKINWTITNTMSEPNEIVNFIHDSVNNAKKVSTSTSIHKKQNRFRVPWINNNNIRLCDKRDRLFTAWKNNPTDLKLKLEYNKARNKVHKVLEHSRNSYYMKKINDNSRNTKKLYQIINQMLGRVSLSIDQAIMNAFDSQGLTAKEIADNFATGFDEAVKDIIPKCSAKLLDTDNDKQTDSSMHFQEASIDKIHKIIKQLNSNKAPGLDNVNVTDIKMAGRGISVALTNLINRSVKMGSYPETLKMGCVRPIFKKGKKDEYSNYRPITLLPSVDKIVEKFICEQMHTYFRKHDVIYTNQFGFQQGKGTAELLSKFIDEVNEYLNDKNNVLVLFIDFSRAFDTLDHTKLIKKLDECGIRGPLLNWCKNYLQDRKYCVKICNAHSNTIEAKYGTAQGSVLGPLHFLSYVNNMRNVLKYCSCYQYADDTCIVIGRSDINVAYELLQADFDILSKWCHDAGLVLNVSKTKLMHIKSPYLKCPSRGILKAHNHSCMHSNNPQSCTCPEIELVNSYTYLGLTIDNHINWGQQIERVCNKLRQFMANMYILNSRIPYKVKLALYNSLAESYIQYGISSYGRTYKTYLDAIYKLQLKILKLIVPPVIKEKFRKNEPGLFKYCKVLPVQLRFKYSLLKENYFNPKYQNKIEHPVFTRAIAQGRLRTSKARNVYGRHTTQYLVPRLINQLPPTLKSELNCKNVKYKLKLHFLNN